MTTTTAHLNDSMNAAPARLVQSACIRHGLLDGGHRDGFERRSAPGALAGGRRAAEHCPACGRQAYQLDDDGDRATLRAFRKAALKARIRNAAIGGYVGTIALKSVAGFVTGTAMGLEVISTHGFIVAGLCAAVAYFARSHKLDKLLG